MDRIVIPSLRRALASFLFAVMNQNSIGDIGFAGSAIIPRFRGRAIQHRPRDRDGQLREVQPNLDWPVIGIGGEVQPGHAAYVGAAPGQHQILQ